MIGTLVVIGSESSLVVLPPSLRLCSSWLSAKLSRQSCHSICSSGRSSRRDADHAALWCGISRRDFLYLTQFLQQVLGASPTSSGLMLMPLIFSLAVTSIVVGRVVSKLGRYKVIMFAGLLIATAGVLSLATLTIHSTFWDVAWHVMITGAGLGASMPIFNLIVQNEAPHQEQVSLLRQFNYHEVLVQRLVLHSLADY